MVVTRAGQHDQFAGDPAGPNRLSSYTGAMAQAGQEPPDTAPSAVDKSAGTALGERVAQAVLRWNK
jgi:hypothetical protein